MVRVVRLERTVSWSQTRRDTNFAIPGYSISAIIPRRRGKSKIFLSVVKHVVKAAFVPLSAAGENPANAGVTRLCGVSPCPVPDTATALPNVAPYQLSHTRLFTFLSLYHGGEENQRFSVCGHLCGQSRFCAVFGNRGKSRKRRCCKALRRFSLPCPGYSHGTPKAGALPTALHPVIYCRLERPPHSIPYSAPVFKSFLHRRPQKVCRTTIHLGQLNKKGMRNRASCVKVKLPHKTF